MAKYIRYVKPKELPADSICMNTNCGNWCESDGCTIMNNCKIWQNGSEVYPYRSDCVISKERGDAYDRYLNAKGDTRHICLKEFVDICERESKERIEAEKEKEFKEKNGSLWRYNK